MCLHKVEVTGVAGWEEDMLLELHVDIHGGEIKAMQKALRSAEFGYKPIQSTPISCFPTTKLVLTALGLLFHFDTQDARCSSSVDPALESWVGREAIVIHEFG